MSEKVQKKYQKQRRRKNSITPLLVGLGGLLLLIAAVLALNGNNKPAAAIEVAGQPSLKVDKEQVDLGAVKLGEVVKVSFELTNVGDQPLKFSKAPYVEVKEGC